MTKTPFGPEDMARRRKRAHRHGADPRPQWSCCSSSPPSCVWAAASPRGASEMRPRRSRRNLRVAVMAAGRGRRHGGPRLCLRAALPAVLPGHRLRRHDAARRGSARRRPPTRPSPCASMPIPRPASTGPSMPIQPSMTVQHRRAEHGLLQGHQHIGQAADRHGRVQRHARAGRRLLQQDPVLLLYRADAAARRIRRHAGGLLRRSRPAGRSGRARDQGNHAVLHLLSG